MIGHVTGQRDAYAHSVNSYRWDRAGHVHCAAALPEDAECLNMAS